MTLEVKIPMLIEPLMQLLKKLKLDGMFGALERVSGVLRGSSLRLAQAVDVDPFDAFGRLVARLRSIDVGTLSVSGFSSGRLTLEEQQRRIATWACRVRENINVPSVAMEVALSWLAANTHAAISKPVLVQGDFGYHNILLQHEKAAARFDWELVHVGSAAADLAYLKGFIDNFDGLFTAYAGNSGTIPESITVAYYELFGYVRNSICGLISFHNFPGGHPKCLTRDRGKVSHLMR
jgi:aminoglycoside phosphotransferase (APT) family kinase protein